MPRRCAPRSDGAHALLQSLAGTVPHGPAFSAGRLEECGVTPRANWKGHLKVGELACAVALHTAASTGERIAFHTVDRKTGHRVRRQFVDGGTGKPVPAAEQVKGYDIGQGEYVVLEPEEIAAAVPESDKVLAVEAFLACDDIDDVYLERPYFLVPADAQAQEAYAAIREGMRAEGVAALARTVLFRRVRTLLLRAHDAGMIATTLNFDYEVVPAAEAFAGIPARKLKGEMLELARHIVSTKRGHFDPAEFEDRYEAALAELVQAKLAGKRLPASPRPEDRKVVDLMEALRRSAGAAGKAPPKGRKRAPARRTAGKAQPRRKAG